MYIPSASNADMRLCTLGTLVLVTTFWFSVDSDDQRRFGGLLCVLCGWWLEPSTLVGASILISCFSVCGGVLCWLVVEEVACGDVWSSSVQNNKDHFYN